MKTIKIYAVPSHATKERMSGVDMVRVVQPTKYLNKFRLGDTEFETKIYDPKTDEGKADWRVIAKEYDIIFLNYTVGAWGFAAMGAMARKYGKPIILDVDDNLWNIQPDNPSFPAFEANNREALRNFTSICNEVDYITTTNKYLRNLIVRNTRKHHEEIKIFPNYIDLKKLYTHRTEFKDDGLIQLLHFGSTTHFADLSNERFAKGIDMIMKDYPNVKLLTVGAFTPKYKRRWGARYDNDFGHTDVYKWIKEKYPTYMDKTDIFVTPLEDNIYNMCKSNIKWLEVSAAKIPGVWQDIRQYRGSVDEGKTGLLADTAKEWYSSIKTLIDDKNLRRKMGENAFKAVESEWQIQQHIHQYAAFFKWILTIN